MKTFSICHPSRQRPVQAFDTAMKWINSAHNKEGVEYVIAVDIDDPTLPIYLSLFKGKQFKIIRGRSKNVVMAMNLAASHANNEIFVCVSDDFESCENWDLLIDDAIDKDKLAIQVSDGIVNKPNASYVLKYGRNEIIMTIPILTKVLYNNLGYIYYPLYTGCFADNDLAEACNSIGCLKQMPQIEFTHKHYTNGHAPYDATYARHNTALSWKIGESLIKKRRAEGFNLINAL
jgi:hypothetical protein